MREDLEEEEEGEGRFWSQLTSRGATVHQISARPAGAMASHDGPAPKQKGGSGVGGGGKNSQ